MSDENRGITIKGSDTILPLSQKHAEVFGNINRTTRLVATGGGSGSGFVSLIEGKTDIAMASRKINLAERNALQQGDDEVKEVVIAYDALAIIVNVSNKVNQLNREQIEAIFTGKIANWNEVGGDDLKIVVYDRDVNSGTYEFFKEHILNNKNYGSQVLSLSASSAIIQSVGENKGAVGYVGLAYLENTIKPLRISFNQKNRFVAPSMATAKDKSYPIIRPLYYYYLASNEANLKSFIDFVLSAAGQKDVQEIGYVPLK